MLIKFAVIAEDFLFNLEYLVAVWGFSFIGFAYIILEHLLLVAL